MDNRPRTVDRTAHALLLAALTVSGSLPACKQGAAPAPVNRDPTPSALPPAVPPPDGKVRISRGDFESGSLPGRTHRISEWEALPERVRLGEYEIDAVPYSINPGQLLLGATKDQASLRCTERGGRLCTELEWEYACRGSRSTLFASGEQWQPACSEGSGCASEFGVYGLGNRLEWTASNASENSMLPGEPMLRGAFQPSGDDARCTRRGPLLKEQASAVAFRCCYGPPNAARVHDPEDGVVFERPKLTADRIKTLLAEDAITAPLAKDLKLFSDPESPNTVISRGPGDRMGFDFTAEPLLWRPARGIEVLLLSGKSGKNLSFVLAYYSAGADRYALASSFILEDEPGPVVFAYSASIRPRVHFSTCWGCVGETGKILFRAPDSVVILQP